VIMLSFTFRLNNRTQLNDLTVEDVWDLVVAHDFEE